MKRNIMSALVVVLALLFAAAGAVSAVGPDVPWWVIAGGGGSAGGGNVTLNDTLGEPIIGASIGGTGGASVALDAGYWQQLYGPAAVTGLRATVVTEMSQRKVRLEWTAVGSDTVGHTIAGVTYNVYRQQDAPYFTPSGASYNPAPLADPEFTDSNASVLTDWTHSTYYVVKAIYIGMSAAHSNRVGAFVFALAPGD